MTTAAQPHARDAGGKRKRRARNSPEEADAERAATMKELGYVRNAAGAWVAPAAQRCPHCWAFQTRRARNDPTQCVYECGTTTLMLREEDDKWHVQARGLGERARHAQRWREHLLATGREGLDPFV